MSNSVCQFVSEVDTLSAIPLLDLVAFCKMNAFSLVTLLVLSRRMRSYLCRAPDPLLWLFPHSTKMSSKSESASRKCAVSLALSPWFEEFSHTVRRTDSSLIFSIIFRRRIASRPLMLNEDHFLALVHLQLPVDDSFVRELVNHQMLRMAFCNSSKEYPSSGKRSLLCLC